jgi:hypothetical protein
MDAGDYMRQAHMTAGTYAAAAIRDLCEELGIDRANPNWVEQLAPFAPVLAAMIAAASADFDTMWRHGRD